jgi:thiol-disulfide isomerase/thioredoxin
MKNIKILFITLGLIFIFSSFGFAQNVTLTALNGEEVSIQSQKGKVVVLAIGATWLPLSKSQAVITNRLAKKYGGRDVVIYFVTTDSSSAKSKNYASNEDIQAFVTKAKLSSSVLRDSDGTATLKKFKIDQIPAFLIFDKEGKLAAEPFGGLTPTPEAENDLVNQISRRIDEIL